MQKENIDKKLKQLIGIFLVDGKFQKENFRGFVLAKMYKILLEIRYYSAEAKYSYFWQKVNDFAVIMKREDLKKGIVEIKELSNKLDKWIRDSLINKERFEFCILSKALEIKSGNETFDYFQAQLIRHDQFLSALLIFEESCKHLKELVKLNGDEMEDSRHLLFFLEKGIDERIFELAVNFYELRK